MRKGKIILGIDPGTRLTGWGVITLNGSKYNLISYGVIKPKQKDSSGIYLCLFEEITKLIETYSPDAVSTETQYVAKNPQSAIKLGMARACALLAAAKKNVPFFEYAPSKAKIAATGTGSASKEQVQKMIQRLLSLSEIPTPEDASDALALAICHAHHSKYNA